MKKIISGIFIVLIFIGCNSTKQEKNRLIIFHAGSLSIPFKEMKDQFEKENPDVEIWLESAGSVQCARKIIDLKKDCDIMASADYTVIDELLIPDYASWNIQFASNEMAIVYHETSRYADEINDQNWYNILLRDDVFFGRSDPNSDPCGYRAVLTTQLAECYYNKPGLTENIKAKNQEYIRPKEVDLLALLESNSIDYIYLYRSVATQHELKYIVLPDSINLKNPELEDYYQKSSIEITGKEPGTSIIMKGQALVYGITILKNAPNKALAEKFLTYMFSEKGGQKIMEENGQPAMCKTNPSYFEKIPVQLQKHIKP